MHFVGPDAERLEDLVRGRKLKTADLGYLMVMSHNMEPSGRVNLRPRGLADKLGVSDDSCRNALRRLQQHNLAVRVQDPGTGGTYFLLNPFLLTTGTPRQRAALWAQFKSALEIPKALG